jgi:branched-chain amino acid transport system substrate-binding protein
VPSTLRFGLSLSLSGRYASFGRQAEAALALLVDNVNASGGIRVGGERREMALECLDDASDAERCAAIYRSLCFENRADIVLGPYSSELARVAAPIAEQAGMLLVNHGGAADDLYAHNRRLIVGVLSAASDYLEPFVRLLAGLKLWRKRLAIVRSESGFARAVADGIERAAGERFARRKGVKIRVKFAGQFDPASTPAKLFPALKRNRVNALVSAGSYAHDLAVMRAVATAPLNIPVLACVAAGVESFGRDLGEDAEGIVGPSQWEDQIDFQPEIGPRPREFRRRMRAARVDCDYPAAQAYAAGLLTRAAIENAGALDQQRIREAFSDLRTSTLFGDFAIDRVTGRQIGHRMLLVQWHRGSKVVIEPEAHADSPALEFPSGWRLILASFHMLKMGRGVEEEERDEDADE